MFYMGYIHTINKIRNIIFLKFRFRFATFLKTPYFYSFKFTGTVFWEKTTTTITQTQGPKNWPSMSEVRANHPWPSSTQPLGKCSVYSLTIGCEAKILWNMCVGNLVFCVMSVLLKITDNFIRHLGFNSRPSRNTIKLRNS